MKVSDLVPNLYNKNVEMTNIIYSEDEEFENILKPDIDKAFADNFPKTATISGIENFEKLLNIQLDENKDNIEYRRDKVLTILTTMPPLTYTWLTNSLNELLGVNNYYINLDYANYILSIQVSDKYQDTAETIYDFYRPLIPANLDFEVTVIETESTNLYFGTVIHEGEKNLIKVIEEEN